MADWKRKQGNLKVVMTRPKSWCVWVPGPFCFSGVVISDIKKAAILHPRFIGFAELLTRRTHMQESKAFRADRK